MTEAQRLCVAAAGVTWGKEKVPALDPWEFPSAAVSGRGVFSVLAARTTLGKGGWETRERCHNIQT